MTDTPSQSHQLEGAERTRTRLATSVGWGSLLAFAGTLTVGYAAGRTKLVGIVAFAFVAMAAGVAVNRYSDLNGLGQLWTNGTASGAMLASAAALLAPKAITAQPTYGGFAIAFGYLFGYAGHELGHLVSHRSLPVNATVTELTAHAALAGSIMGVVYGTLPSLTPVFGYGVVAHKFPAGVGGAVSLDRDGLPTIVMALPAAAVGLAAVPLSLATPTLSPLVTAVFYGISTGVFAHVALDLIPDCSGGGSGHDHGSAAVCSPEQDRHRVHAVVSTLSGVVVLLLAWLAVA